MSLVQAKGAPSLDNVGDMKLQTEKLLNAANNLDNGKEMEIPKPLLNPKEIAAMVIQK